MYVLGDDIPRFDIDSLHPPLLAAWSRGGESIGRPPGTFLFAYPRAALDSAGRLHVLWGEPDPVGTAVPTSIRITSVWYASYAPGSGWTTPRRIYSSTAMTWDGVSIANIVTDRRGRLRFAVAADRYMKPTVIASLVLEHEGWHAVDVPLPSVGGYTSIAADATGRLYLAYIAPDPSALPDANSVFVTRSRDDGRTWDAPILISHSGDREATNLRVLATSDGSVHLVWGQNLSGGLRAEVVRHVASRDGGRTWSAPTDLDAPDGFNSLRAVADHCGAIHVVYSDGRGDLVSVEYARWEHGQWIGPHRLFPDRIAASPEVAVTPAGSVLLVATVWPAGVSAHTLPTTIWSELPATARSP